MVPAQGHGEFRCRLERTTPTNLRDGHQVRHVLEIIGSEIRITSCFDFLQGFAVFRAELHSAIPVLGQLPRPEGQLKISRGMCSNGAQLRTNFRPLLLWSRVQST